MHVLFTPTALPVMPVAVSLLHQGTQRSDIYRFEAAPGVHEGTAGWVQPLAEQAQHGQFHHACLAGPCGRSHHLAMGSTHTDSWQARRCKFSDATCVGRLGAHDTDHCVALTMLVSVRKTVLKHSDCTGLKYLQPAPFTMPFTCVGSLARTVECLRNY